MSFAAFMDGYFEVGRPKSAEDRGYLAQHALFEQVPSLKRDFAVPKYCQIGRILVQVCCQYSSRLSMRDILCTQVAKYGI